MTLTIATVTTLINNFFINVIEDYNKEQKKFELCWSLLRLHKNFITDLKLYNLFLDDRKIDVFDLDSRIAYVILNENEHEPAMLKSNSQLDFEVQYVYIIPCKKIYSMSLSRREYVKKKMRRLRDEIQS